LARDAAPSTLGIRWLVDFSWVRLPVAALAETDRMIVRLLAGVFFLWLGLLLWLFQR